MSLVTPETIRKLQAALYVKAKESPQFRFYSLYDKVYRADVLTHAYKSCKANGGTAGVDGETFADIETKGWKRWLRELAECLRNKTYQPSAVKRVYIPKPNGSKRPLGIPTIRDRVVETAAMLVVEPIFEADLQPEQYAYRPVRGALDAVKRVHKLVLAGHTEVVDADLSGYFDSIPHVELMTSVRRRICDKQMLCLIKMWLDAPVEETDNKRRKRRTTRNKDEGKGTPQGSPFSPLLSNIYMRRFLLGWKVKGVHQHLKAHIVNYADDFVICCRGTAEQASTVMRQMITQLKLTVNETKTRICVLPNESFDFLGYTIGRSYSRLDGHAYLGKRPSKKSIKRVMRNIHECTKPKWCLMEDWQIVRRLNQILIGWANYYCLGALNQPYRAIDEHARYRLRQWLRRKHKMLNAGYSRYPDKYLDEELGLVRLMRIKRNLPCAKA